MPFPNKEKATGDGGTFAETDWFEIFQAGDYGNKGNYSVGDLKDMADAVNSGGHIPPIVIGHDTDKDWSKPLPSELADGALNAAKVEGNRLLGKASVSDRVKDFWDDSRLLSWSVGAYKNFQGKGTKAIRHLASLGKTPPQIKGLKYKPQFIFNEDEINGEFDEVIFSKTTNGDNDTPTGANDMSIEEQLKAENERLKKELAKVDQAKFDELQKDHDDNVVDLDKVRKERDEAKKRADKAEEDLKDEKEKASFAEIERELESDWIPKGLPKDLHDTYRIARAHEMGLTTDDGQVTFAEGKKSEMKPTEALKALREAKMVPVEEEGGDHKKKTDFSTFSESDVEAAQKKRGDLIDKRWDEKKKVNEHATFAEASQEIMNEHPELYPDMQ